MNWKYFRKVSWIDTRAKFVYSIPKNDLLLDIGSSDGETLNHFHELRPDLKFIAMDIDGNPVKYPLNTVYKQVNLENQLFALDDESIGGITCMHVVEHLLKLDNLLNESFRVLKKNALMYIETPHPKSLILSSPDYPMTTKFTLNFYDDLSHIKPVTIAELVNKSEMVGFQVINNGISRNWLFAFLYPLYFFMKPSRKKYISFVHFLGWSNYIIIKKK